MKQADTLLNDIFIGNRWQNLRLCNIMFYIHHYIVGVIFEVSDEHLFLSALESQAQLVKNGSSDLNGRSICTPYR